MATPKDFQHRAPNWFAVAAVAGALHTAITIYWACGGEALMWSMGESFIAKFSDVLWVLFPLALLKGLGAFMPMWLAQQAWPVYRLSRFACWAGSVVLILWGGANTLVGNAVLFGAIHPSGGFDRLSMIGHAWIWDPLFLVWGLSLAFGLWSTRRGRGSAEYGRFSDRRQQ